MKTGQLLMHHKVMHISSSISGETAGKPPGIPMDIEKDYTLFQNGAGCRSITISSAI